MLFSMFGPKYKLCLVLLFQFFFNEMSIKYSRNQNPTADRRCLLGQFIEYYMLKQVFKYQFSVLPQWQRQ